VDTHNQLLLPPSIQEWPRGGRSCEFVTNEAIQLGPRGPLVVELVRHRCTVRAADARPYFRPKPPYFRSIDGRSIDGRSIDRSTIDRGEPSRIVYLRRTMSGDDQKTRTIEEADNPAVRPQHGMIPGVVGIFSQGQPINLPIPVRRQKLEIGRGATYDATKLVDDSISRNHTLIEWRGEEIRVVDRGSHNGTFVDGRRVEDEGFPALPRTLRIGSTLFRFTLDVRPFLKGEVSILDGRVIGPTLRERYEEIARVAAAGETLLLTGPSGSGKELAAQAFHEAGKRGGPFVAVNCATIPAGLAERLLFGARRGAYSGAGADAEGYVQAADGGTLFLDEIAELDATVQAKLLRVLETREVVPLGAPAGRKVDIRICTATLKDLRGEVAAGRFRRDLYYRVGSPEVLLPSLMERLEELPWLARAELQRMDPRLAPSLLFLEECALRPWPGNVRELLRELRSAGRAARSAGRVVVEATDLSPSAGRDIAVEPRSEAPPEAPRRAKPKAPSRATRDPLPSAPTPSDVSRASIEAALEREQGNVARSARALGMHRTQLRRWIVRYGIDPATFDSPDGKVDTTPTDQGTRPAKE
jgi:DNA-binding NtrC family response regulator